MLPKYKNILICIIASIITCGIYDFFWLVSIANSVNRLDKARQKDSTSGGMVLLFTILTCGIYGIYWSYKTGERIDRMKNDRGIPTSNNTGITYLFLRLMPLILSVLSISIRHFEKISKVTAVLGGIFGILLYCLMQNEVNKLIARDLER